MKSVIQVTCSALFLCTSGAQLAAADDAATSPMSLARSLQPASVYPALEETLKAAEAKLDVRLSCVARAYQLNRVLIRVSFLQAYYEKHLAELRGVAETKEWLLRGHPDEGIDRLAMPVRPVADHPLGRVACDRRNPVAPPSPPQSGFQGL